MDITLKVKPAKFCSTDVIKGGISVSYPGRYDGIVINAQVLDSNHHIIYTSYNGKNISNIARLFIPHSDVIDNSAEFEAEAKFEADRSYEVKFRASIIEQHKEVDSTIVFVEYTPGSSSKIR